MTCPTVFGRRHALHTKKAKEPKQMRDRTVLETSVTRFEGLCATASLDRLAVEEPVEFQLAFGPVDERRVKPISVTMRTPGHDFELAAGFLMSEGLIYDAADIDRLTYVSGRTEAADNFSQQSPEERKTVAPYQPERNIVRIELMPDVRVNLPALERNFYTTSSCGICGKASLLALRTVCPPRSRNTFTIPAEALYALPSRLRDAQDVFEKTGGLHAAALFDCSGVLRSTREDVGRHNAVDKLLGAEFMADRTPLRDRLLMLSGRASFELLQKALMAGIPMVASIGAPSSLAVQVAKEFDITLVGFLRSNHFNVYQGTQRVTEHITEESRR
jgi:FdhD protein